MTTLMEELREICAALQIHGSDAFTFRGVASHTHQPAPLASSLCNVLYEQCYIRSEVPSTAAGNLNTSLIQANHTRDRWDSGWKIYHIKQGGRIFVQKGECSRVAPAGAYSIDKWTRDGPRIGDQVSLRVFAGTTELQTAFFHSFGETLSDQFDEFSAVRFYFNIRFDAASTLLAALSATLNRYAIPFHFKTLVEAAQYCRADCSVLYIARRYFQIVQSIVSDLPGVLNDGLRVATPLFCKTLLPGIGMADDPGTGESFGMHRCKLVAEGLVAAWLDGAPTVDACLAAIQARFASDGYSLERPWLNPRSHDIFAQTMFNGEYQA